MFQSNFAGYIPKSDQNSESDRTIWPVAQNKSQSENHSVPTKSEILLELGILYWRRGNFDRSEQLITKALEVYEGDIVRTDKDWEKMEGRAVSKRHEIVDIAQEYPEN